jgi:PAS domain S-box-containing protein
MLEKVYGDYWKTVIDTMLEGLMLVDPDGRIVFVNRAFEQLSGYSLDELVGKSCEVIGCDTCFGTRAEGKDKYCALFKEGDVRRRKCIFRRKDGTAVHVLKNAATIKDRTGKVVGGVENMTDLSPLVAQEQVITQLRKQLQGMDGFHGMLGNSLPMLKVFDLVTSAAASEAPVIIYGESGTGKEMVAAAVHRLGARSSGPYIKVNCAALNENLLESELFGHVKGAFTGAEQNRIGRFEAADKGDIFLDEIGDLPMATQTKLLRVLQEKEFERVGDHNPISLDVRVIAATNKNLEKLMTEGRFRDDLFYRLNVIPIYLPPLRARREDVPLLTEAFIQRLQLKTGKSIIGISKNAMEQFLAYDWPGNVRELINALEYAFVLCPQDEITCEHLPAKIGVRAEHGIDARSATMPGVVQQEERRKLIEALQESGGNKTAAARRLGISRVTLWKRLKKHNIQGEYQLREQVD